LVRLPAHRGRENPHKHIDGFKSAASDRAQVQLWQRQHPYSNVAAAAGEVSGFFVVDMDPSPGSEGRP
jgi:hypothetical protein